MIKAMVRFAEAEFLANMHLTEIIWKDAFVDKIEVKHGVSPIDVEQVLFSRPHVRRAQRGRVKGEDLYVAYGQTLDGRHLVVFFIRKYQSAALPISARDMTDTERRYYEQKGKAG